MPDVDINAERRQLHELVEHLRPEEIASVKQYLESKVDSFERMLLSAPVDEEPVTDQDRSAIAEASRRRQRGERPLTGEELLRDLGLSESDLL